MCVSMAAANVLVIPVSQMHIGNLFGARQTFQGL